MTRRTPRSLVRIPIRLGHAAGVVISLVLSTGSLMAQDGALVTDRPGLLFSTQVVGRGVWQLESGVAYTGDEEGRIDATSWGLATSLRLGLGDDLELRLGAPLWTRVEIEGPFFDLDDEGYGDLELGFKWSRELAAVSGMNIALIPAVTLPTGERGFSAEEPVGSLNAVASAPLGAAWSGTALLGARGGEDEAGERFGAVTIAILAGRALPADGWSGYLEAGWTFPDEGGDVGLVGAGVTYLLSDDVQLDTSFDAGLTDAAPDLQLGVGLSVRF